MPNIQEATIFFEGGNKNLFGKFCRITTPCFFQTQIATLSFRTITGIQIFTQHGGKISCFCLGLPQTHDIKTFIQFSTQSFFPRNYFHTCPKASPFATPINLSTTCETKLGGTSMAYKCKIKRFEKKIKATIAIFLEISKARKKIFLKGKITK